MKYDLEALKAELERFGAENDASTADLDMTMRNITRATGEFLGLMVRACAASRILEIGTSNGYSTLWLAEAASAGGGLVTTVEISEYKTGLALDNFTLAGLKPNINLIHDDAAGVLARLKDASFDFLFLDSDRSAYPAWWPHIRRILRPGGTLAADNAVSHAGELAPFLKLVRSDPEFTASVVPVGKGVFLAVKSRPPAVPLGPR